MLSLLRGTIRRFTKDSSGAAAIEYGLIIAGIAVIIAGAIFLLGPTISEMFTEVSDKMEAGG